MELSYQLFTPAECESRADTHVRSYTVRGKSKKSAVRRPEFRNQLSAQVCASWLLEVQRDSVRRSESVSFTDSSQGSHHWTRTCLEKDSVTRDEYAAYNSLLSEGIHKSSCTWTFMTL